MSFKYSHGLFSFWQMDPGFHPYWPPVTPGTAYEDLSEDAPSDIKELFKLLQVFLLDF